jgi:hypothetical protein
MGGSWVRNAIDALMRKRSFSGQRAGNGGESSSGAWLALIPLVVAIVFGALLVPHAAPPETVPLPTIDTNQVERIIADDHALANQARATPLPAEVRAVGTAIRAFYMLQTGNEKAEQVAKSRLALDRAVAGALSIDGGLAKLRAVQLEDFLAATHDFERTGVESEEMKALGGNFVKRVQSAGWADGNKIHLSDSEMRAMYKAAWNAAINAPPNASLAPKMDETRVLYALYLRAPHPPEAARDLALAQRKVANDATSCNLIEVNEGLATEAWRLDKIRKLGTIDPEYPTAFAIGASEYRMGKYRDAAEAFRSWIAAHPEGPWSLRAHDHLVASMQAEGVL